MRILTILPLLATVAACGSATDETGQNIAVNDSTLVTSEGSAPLLDGEGQTVGTVDYREEGSGVMLVVAVSGLDAGTHAVHLHQTGLCEGSDFASAGGHWNPTGAEHGRDNPQGAHMGDLANMVVAEDGSGRSDFMVSGASVAGADPAVSDADGTALVIHAGEDDYRTDPAGDAGARIACAVIAAPSA